MLHIKQGINWLDIACILATLALLLQWLKDWLKAYESQVENEYFKKTLKENELPPYGINEVFGYTVDLSRKPKEIDFDNYAGQEQHFKFKKGDK